MAFVIVIWEKEIVMLSTHSAHHGHGVGTGLFLAFGIAAIGFLLQADLAKVLEHGGKQLMLGGLLMATILLVLLKVRIR